MRRLSTYPFLLLILLLKSGTASGYISPEWLRTPRPSNIQPRFRENCDNAIARVDQAINNVRARLTTGGDVWWDGNDGRYVVPKVPPGVPEVSAIFAGAVWLGGVDPAGNLKVAAQTYGRSRGNFDYYPGPLDPDNGRTTQATCAQWDRLFVVKGENVQLHLRNWQKAQRDGVAYNPKDIPRDIKGWPARGNQFFFEIHRFELPNTSQGLAGFWDQDGDGLYNPERGDFPVIEIRGCTQKPQFPDEMIFWIYNDAGGIHAESRADPIQMEVQVQAFSYATNDEINDMTFQRYKLINRAVESINNTYFAMWVDPDLGCYTDDYVGCDTTRGLAYVYNEDALDGQTGCACPGGVNTYCADIPILGVDYFRGPLDENGEEIGMSSFTYYNNAGVGGPPPGTTDPSTAQEYYNYLSGFWRDGTPFTYGGDAYQENSFPIRYAFTEAPNNPSGWSMCTERLPFGDRRTIQASGPFRLDPGAVNELIVGVVWVGDQVYPCPDISKLLEADDIAQSLFDNCFELTDGPDAPDVDFIELDREIIAVFTNDTITSNNAFEAYAERGLQVPAGEEDSLYLFEGYKLYQLNGSGVSTAELDNPDKARLIYQVDIRNGVGKIFNWRSVENPTGQEYYVPELKVEGQDQGIRHTFRITEDQFAEGNRKLVNHKKYYFLAVAYAYNNYRPFDPKQVIGQRRPYLEGRRNIGDGVNPYYTVIPRPITDRKLNADFGEGVEITRIEGVGTGSNFLDMEPAVRLAILDGSFKGEITYRPGRGPLEVKIFNPLGVKDGVFELRVVDGNTANNTLNDPPVRWELRNLSDFRDPIIFSEKTLDKLNEQIIKLYGFSVAIGQAGDAGDRSDATNGVIGYEEEYLQAGAQPWLFGVRDGLAPSLSDFDQQVFDFVATGDGQPDAVLDPTQAFSNVGPGYFVPYRLANYRNFDGRFPGYITPAWTDLSGNGIAISQMRLQDLNNVDIVLTSNKAHWSRCIVLEAANRFHAAERLVTQGNRRHFDLRAAPNVSREDANNDGLPDTDTQNAGTGFAWFPGYAVDVETGQRLNIFFAENSVYTGFNDTRLNNGRDMMFNPSSILSLGSSQTGELLPYIAGGQHFIYVTKQPYDGCQNLEATFRGPSLSKLRGVREITWAGLLMLRPGVQLKSYRDGLIPSDVVVKLRVKNLYDVRTSAAGKNRGYPTYQFVVKDKQASALDAVGVSEALRQINIVPNPYYGFADYEVSQFTTTVKITNLPAKCVVTIYSLDGKFIRQYRRDETGSIPRGNNRAVERQQIAPALEWDLKNAKGIPIGSGVYLVHIDAGELGQRTIKWFGVNRKFDPSGL